MQNTIEIKRFNEKDSIFVDIESDSNIISINRGIAIKKLLEKNTDLSYSDLSYSNLSYSNLRGSDLSYSDLRGSDLSYSDLRGSDLSYSNLSYSNLRGSNLSGSDLRGSKNISELFAAQNLIICEGDIIGYKKLANNVICKLFIPKEAKRFNATGRKCRAEYAKVLEGEGVSIHDNNFKYVVGETVKPTKEFNLDRWNECSTGIHFFLTKIEAENYDLIYYVY